MSTVQFLGECFGSTKERDQYAFQRKDYLLPQIIEKRDNAQGIGFIAGLIAGIIGITYAHWHWITFFLWTFGLPATLRYYQESKIKKIEEYSNKYYQTIKKIEKEIRKDILEPFNKRYFSSEQKQEHIKDLVNLINHKKKLPLNEADGELIISIYLKEYNINLFDEHISKLKDKDSKSLAQIFLKLSPHTEIEDIEDEGHNEIIEQFYACLDRKNISYSPRDLEIELKKQSKEKKANEFENKLKRNQDNKLTVDAIEHLDGFEFENFISELFQKAGYNAKKTKKTGDQGADIVIEKDGVSTAVQTKKYSGKVSNKAIQEVVGAMKYYDCDMAMVITTGEFTKSAIELASINEVQLIDKKRLDDLLDDIL